MYTEFYICFFGGILGLHHFIKGNWKKGLLYLFTAGLFGIGWIVDLIIIFANIQSKKSNSTPYKVTVTSNNVSYADHNNPYKNLVPYEIYKYAYSDNKSKTHPNSYIVFDTETTGLEPGIDKIIEISAIKYINGQEVERFSRLVNPQQELDPFITKLTGITNAMLYGKPTIDRVLPSFFNFIEDYALVAHNTPYDIKMIACECYRSNIQMCKNRLVDTVPLAKRMIPADNIDNYKLETLKNYYGINIRSHRGLEDCQVCNVVYQKYLNYEKNKSTNKKVLIVDEETGEIINN